MLAKQGWRLLNEDNPLVTKLMKARYYPNSSFLEAKLGANPSFMWRSIVESKQLLQKGVRRRIGNGEQTNVWKIPWLPCLQNGYITTAMPQELEHVTVANLMTDDSKGWDEDVLNDIYNARDRELIKRIPVSLHLQHDSWFWNLEQTGLFTVKSCYRKLIREQNGPHDRLWRKLWSLDLPGKVTNFIWRTCRDVVPTAAALVAKHVQINTLCPWCMLADETIEHVFFGCSFAQGVWSRVGIQEVSPERCQGPVKEVLCSLGSTCTKQKLSWIAIVCWSLWNRRNRWVWDKIRVSEFGIHAAAANLLNEWKNRQVVKQNHSPVTSSTTRRWCPPAHGWVKINTDAAIFQVDESIGVSCVIRNENGEFVGARASRKSVCLQPREAETIGLKKALAWIKQLGFKKCILETDAKMVVDACKGTQGRSYFHTIVLDCVENFKHFDAVLVEYVHRSANVVTQQELLFLCQTSRSGFMLLLILSLMH